MLMCQQVKQDRQGEHNVERNLIQVFKSGFDKTNMENNIDSELDARLNSIIRGLFTLVNTFDTPATQTQPFELQYSLANER